MSDQITRKDLYDALDAHATRLEGKIDRSEDRIRHEVHQVRADCDDDIGGVNERLTYLERKSVRDSMIGSALAFLGAAFIAIFKN